MQLERLKTENTATVAMLTSHLQSLWDRVDLSQEERCQFLADNSGIAQRVLHSVVYCGCVVCGSKNICKKK